MKKIIFIFLLSMLAYSCARVGSPVGGDKDTIPPTVLGSNIDTSRVNVPRDIRELRIDFDEYITLRDINKQLIISPPLQRMTKILPSGIANKYLLIQWKDTLQANTTYNFNFGNAIRDNNEGNALQYYNFAFSTGDKIDDLYISGEAKSLISNESNDTRDPSVVVGLYKETDSMDYRQKPYYITKADPDGYYELNYLSPGTYRILAFEDANENSVYDAGTENISFLKDSVVLDKSISGLNLNLYPSRKAVKYVEMKETPGGVLMTFEGNPQEVKVLALNEKIKDYRITHRPKSDSLNIWFDAEAVDVGITQSENLRFSYDDGVKQDTVSLFYRYNTKNEMTISNAGGNLLAPAEDFVITSTYFIDKIDTDKWTLVSDSISQGFTAEISAANPFQLRVKSDFKEGKKYSLTVPKETVASYFDAIAKSYRFDFEAAKTENFGSLILTLQNPPAQNFWLQLLDEGNKIVYSTFGKESTISFRSLRPAKYKVRILVDNNGNGIWDRADLVLGEFAEEVYVWDKTVDVRPLWEIRETWNLNKEAEQPAAQSAPANIPPAEEPKTISTDESI